MMKAICLGNVFQIFRMDLPFLKVVDHPMLFVANEYVCNVGFVAGKK